MINYNYSISIIKLNSINKCSIKVINNYFNSLITYYFYYIEIIFILIY